MNYNTSLLCLIMGLSFGYLSASQIDDLALIQVAQDNAECIYPQLPTEDDLEFIGPQQPRQRRYPMGPQLPQQEDKEFVGPVYYSILSPARGVNGYADLGSRYKFLADSSDEKAFLDLTKSNLLDASMVNTILDQGTCSFAGVNFSNNEFMLVDSSLFQHFNFKFLEFIDLSVNPILFINKDSFDCLQNLKVVYFDQFVIFEPSKTLSKKVLFSEVSLPALDVIDRNFDDELSMIGQRDILVVQQRVSEDDLRTIQRAQEDKEIMQQRAQEDEGLAELLKDGSDLVKKREKEDRERFEQRRKEDQELMQRRAHEDAVHDKTKQEEVKQIELYKNARNVIISKLSYVSAIENVVKLYSKKDKYKSLSRVKQDTVSNKIKLNKSILNHPNTKEFLLQYGGLSSSQGQRVDNQLRSYSATLSSRSGMSSSSSSSSSI